MKQEELFRFDEPITLEEVFEAYYECRKHKRRTINALSFELDLEKNLIKLWKDINNKTYEIGRSIAFIVEKPVKREIFAANFRDRVVHHLVIRKLEEYFEKTFSRHSCSCRKGMGTMAAIRQTSAALKRQAARTPNGCYVLKLDIQAFFMSIDCGLLCEKLLAFVNRYYQKADKNILLWLVEKIVLNRPQENCVCKGDDRNWKGLPPQKSLFHARGLKGMPIGNLTSQIFANFYLNAFDQHMESFKTVDYVRYVDDFVLIHPSRKGLARLAQKAKVFLKENLHLTLHPKKVYLQHYQKGFEFVGVRFKGFARLAGQRLKRNFLSRVTDFNRYKHCLTPARKAELHAFFNSYCGYLKHLNAYRLRIRAWKLLDERVRGSYCSSCLKLAPLGKSG